MAVTKIWDIKGWIGKVVMYVENPDKTENKEFQASPLTDADIQGMEDVMEYAMTDERAKDFGHIIEYAIDGKKTEQQYYVSSLNCEVETARQEMLLTKKTWAKTDGITAFHGYQAFKPGEVTPDVAHEIGIKLAQELWGDRFEVVIATHVDKSHVHNHFVLNSVSFKDGYKFYDGNKTYALMRKVSDRLCKEYALSVIKDPQRGKTKHYAEYKAEKEGKPTLRGMVKADVDEAIRLSVTESQFFKNLRAMGYGIKTTPKDISVLPPGKQENERFRLRRRLGTDYTLAAINRRILQNRFPVFPATKPPPATKQYKLVGGFKTVKKLTGFRALYFHYLYLLGKLPKRRQQAVNPIQIYFLYREDLIKLEKFSNEIKLLCRNRIDTSEQLFSYREGLTAEIAGLTDQRKHLRYKARSIRDGDALAVIKSEISDMSQRLGTLRKEVGLCDGIAVHTAEMKAKMRRRRNDLITSDKNPRGKEKNQHEQFRGRG